MVWSKISDPSLFLVLQVSFLLFSAIYVNYDASSNVCKCTDAIVFCLISVLYF